MTPAPRAKELTIYALLDSPSLTGAYRFVVAARRADGRRTSTRGSSCAARCRSSASRRSPACSSTARTRARTFEDFRPEVHDSDGLLLNFGSGEWLWRPLDNPRTLQVSAFRMSDIRGLRPDPARPRLRPLPGSRDACRSCGRAPGSRRTATGARGASSWSRSRPSRTPTTTSSPTGCPNNVPEAGQDAGRLRPTRCTGTATTRTRPPGGRVVATRRDRGTVEGAYRFVVDFAGKKLEALPADTVLRGVVTIASGDETAELLDQQVVKNPVTGGWRLTFQVRAEAQRPRRAARLPRQGRQRADRDLVVRDPAVTDRTPTSAARVALAVARGTPGGRRVARPPGAGLAPGARPRRGLRRGARRSRRVSATPSPAQAVGARRRP